MFRRLIAQISIVQQRTWAVLNISPPRAIPNKIFDGCLITLIFFNVLAVILGTVQPIEQRYGEWLHHFEVFSIFIFTAEYLARVWSCVAHPAFNHPLWGRLRFLIRPMSIVDLLAILPFYIGMLTADLRVLRALQLFRIFRIAKLGHYSASMRLIARIFMNKREELAIAGMIMLVLVMVASSLMYFAEHEAQPDKFSDIPSTMWWAVMTVTTVGYGDVYPITGLGRLLAAMIAVLGILMFALPTGIIGSSFMEEMQRRRAHKSHCPHCGKEIL